MGIQLVVAAGSRAGQIVPVQVERFVIGRAEDCNLKPRSELISRYHCEIFLNDGSWFVRDMGSKNGVFLNDKQTTETIELKNGDKLIIGPLEFFVNLITEEKAQKSPKVESVSDAVARTVALQTDGAQDDQEASIADWLRPDGEEGAEMQTMTIDASELMAQLKAQSEDTAKLEQEQVASETRKGVQNPGHASSRDAASEMLKKFFKGGK